MYGGKRGGTKKKSRQAAVDNGARGVGIPPLWVGSRNRLRAITRYSPQSHKWDSGAVTRHFLLLNDVRRRIYKASASIKTFCMVKMYNATKISYLIATTYPQIPPIIHANWDWPGTNATNGTLPARLVGEYGCTHGATFILLRDNTKCSPRNVDQDTARATKHTHTKPSKQYYKSTTSRSPKLKPLANWT